MVFRHLILSATHAEAGHFTLRTHTPAHSRAPMLELTDRPGERSDRVFPPLSTLSRSAIISGGGDYRETSPPHRRYKKILFYLFFYYAQSFLWRRPGARSASTCHAAAAPICHIAPPPGRPHRTAVQQLTLIVVRGSVRESS